MSDKKSEAIKLLNEAIHELETTKGSVAIGVRKLSRATKLLEKNKINAWCQIYSGNTIYNGLLENLFKEVDEEYQKNNEPQNLSDKKFGKTIKQLEAVGLTTYTIREIWKYKNNIEAGKLNSVDFIEQKLNLLIKEKRGNDGTYYRNPLQEHLSYIKEKAHTYCANLLEQLTFSGTIVSGFDLLKKAVDDKLLDLDPELAEQLMLAFKGISSANKEEWSQALTSCRRLLEALANKLYPPNDKVINKRTFKENQYVNRLWQFMTESIESESNRDLAKTHVDYLGLWLEKNYKITNKGVHSEVSQLEATRVVFHMYLMLSDLLDYLNPSHLSSNSKPSLNTATLDDFEVRLNLKREIAKAIYKVRIEKNGSLTFEDLKAIRGIGPKTIQLAKEQFSE